MLSKRMTVLLGHSEKLREKYEESTGINFLSDIILFSVEENGEKVTGLLFNLTSEKSFKSSFEENNIASNKSVGIMLLESSSSKSYEKLRLIAKKLIAKKTDIYFSHLSNKRKASAYISIWSRQLMQKQAWKYAQLSINKNKIQVNGEFFIENIETTDLGSGHV